MERKGLKERDIKVGQNIIALGDYEAVKKGMIGTVLSVDSSCPSIGVIWHDEDFCGHSCGGRVRSGKGYYVPSYVIGYYYQIGDLVEVLDKTVGRKSFTKGEVKEVNGFDTSISVGLHLVCDGDFYAIDDVKPVRQMEIKENIKKLEDVKMFYVGDKVTGKVGNGYSMTSKYSTCEVIEIVDRGIMKVKILKNDMVKYCVGDEYVVDMDKFLLVERRPFKAGDVVVGNEKAGERYGITGTGYKATISDVISKDKFIIDGFTVQAKYFDLVTPNDKGCEFNVGDIITGTNDSAYGVTDDRGTYEVIEVKNYELIVIKVLKHEISRYIGQTYTVYAEKFEIVENYCPFNVGDIVTGIDDETYGITTNHAVMKVVEVYEDAEKYDDNMRVEILQHAKRERDIGDQYNVESKYFKITKLKKEVKKDKVIESTLHYNGVDVHTETLTVVSEAKGIVTVTIFAKGKKFVGIAKCDTEDIWNEAKGIELATLRASRKVHDYLIYELMK